MISIAKTNNSAEREAKLIALLKNKETIGLEYLYDNYSDALYGIIIRIVQTSSVAEEVLQDAFMKIWNRIDDYDPAKSRLFTWMLNVTRNLAIDKIRSKEIKNSNRTDVIESDSYQLELSTAFEIKVDNIGLREQLKVLSNEQVEIIDLIYYKGYTHSEISKEFHIPLGTVKTRARSALKKLRRFIPEPV